MEQQVDIKDPNKVVYCTAEFRAKVGREDELFNKLQALEEITHKEDGCIQYKVMKKFDHKYAGGNHGGILFNEIWASEEDFEKHCENKHIVDFFQNECIDENGSVSKWNVNVFR